MILKPLRENGTLSDRNRAVREKNWIFQSVIRFLIKEERERETNTECSYYRWEGWRWTVLKCLRMKLRRWCTLEPSPEVVACIIDKPQRISRALKSDVNFTKLVTCSVGPTFFDTMLLSCVNNWEFNVNSYNTTIQWGRGKTRRKTITLGWRNTLSIVNAADK